MGWGSLGFTPLLRPVQWMASYTHFCLPHNSHAFCGTIWTHWISFYTRLIKITIFISLKSQNRPLTSFPFLKYLFSLYITFCKLKTYRFTLFGHGFFFFLNSTTFCVFDIWIRTLFYFIFKLTRRFIILHKFIEKNYCFHGCFKFLIHIFGWWVCSNKLKKE